MPVRAVDFESTASANSAKRPTVQMILARLAGGEKGRGEAPQRAGRVGRTKRTTRPVESRPPLERRWICSV